MADSKILHVCKGEVNIYGGGSGKGGGIEFGCKQLGGGAKFKSKATYGAKFDCTGTEI